MGELHYYSNRKDESLLSCILAGNYRTFKLQREHLKHVYDQLFVSVTA